MVHAGNSAKIEKIRKEISGKGEELRARAEMGSNTGWLHEHDVVKAFEEALAASETNDTSGEKGSGKTVSFLADFTETIYLIKCRAVGGFAQLSNMSKRE